ncbi:hypothetical protein J5U18_08025 [Sphingobacteriaceae bacterium WQ 2009]|uniref:DUF748 domain-containing protein n=1 Tax=Rhinopithecimicrobium faecis TaxID=2820698 RepID=A0A8T4H8S3_9SPHI|nr:hypothetical protein [Sphingobacteriaceae bacterium WQ 2009]
MKPVWKWILSIIAFLLLAAAGATWYLTAHWKPILETKIKELVMQSSDSLYTLSYDDLDLNITLGHITIKNLKITPDTAVYRQLEQAKKAADNRYAIGVKLFKVNGVKIRDIIFNKELSVKSIKLDQPDFNIVNTYHAYNDTISNEPKKSFYEKMKDNLQAIAVEDIYLDSINMKYTQVQQGVKQDYTLRKVNLHVQDILVDSLSSADSSRFYHTKMIAISIPGFEYITPDKFYKASFQELKINTKTRDILLTKVIYRPTMSKPAFYRLKKQATSYIELAFDTLRMDNFDFRSLLNNKAIASRKTLLKGGKVSIYSDKHYPKFPIVKVGVSPHQQLLKVKTLLRLDTILVKNLDLAYTEMSGKFHREGTISFNDMEGVLTNVTNDSAALAKDKWMRSKLAAKVMNQGLLQANFGFDMTSKNGYHTYSGSISPMPATAFNTIIRPLLNVELSSGQIQKVRFDMQGTDYRNWGDFVFDYSGLKINLLKKPGDDDSKKSMKIVSYLVNQFFVNESNPDDKGIHHVAKVNYQRVPEHTFLKTVWQSLLAGIKQCVGLSKEREDKLMGAADTAKSTISSTKEKTKTAAEKTEKFIKGIFKKDKKVDKEDSK